MPRAIAHFEAQSLQVTPAATDHCGQTGFGLMAWLLDASSLEDYGSELKEVSGWMLFRTSP